jgi:ABC-type transporter Mla subunit MlaD
MPAVIIPFPARPSLAPDPDGQERLNRALASLDAAVAAQRMAVADWRLALVQLQATMRGLGQSMERYHDNLGELGTRMAAVNSQAHSLEEWADDVLVPEQGQV